MYKINRKNAVQLAVMTFIFLAAAFFVYKTTILTRMVLPHITTKVESGDNLAFPLEDGDHFEQSFLCDSDELLSVGTSISLNKDAQSNLVANEKNYDLGIVRLKVLDESGTQVMQADYEVYALDDGQNLLASFPGSQTGWKGRTLTLVVDAEKIDPEVELTVGYAKKQAEGTELVINGEASLHTLNLKMADHQFMYWRKLFFIGAMLVYLLLLGTYLGFAVFRFAPQRVFLFTGGMLAVLYLALLPPMSVPDEMVHFKEAYNLSNKLLGKEDVGDENIIMDLEDYHAMQKFDTTPSLSEYDMLKEELFQSGRESGTKVMSLYDTQAPAITYVPGIIGITIGRILGLNGLLVIFLGRFCSILCYLFMMYWFIRLIPVGKPAAFIAAILPMTVQQCCSYSYDSVVIEVAFVYLAVLFGLLYEERSIRRWQIAVYIVCMVILSICKGGTYMPLCLLTMMIPASRFKSGKQKWTFVGCMAAIAIASFLISTLGYVLYVASPTPEQAAGTYLGNDAYGIEGLLADPMNFICLAVRTIFLSGDGFIETMLGMQLGWLNVFVSRIAIYSLLAFMILAVLQTENRKEEIHITVTIGQKIFYIAVACMSCAMVLGALFMSWTPPNATAIEGIQGRYFLPLLPALLLLFRNKNVTVKRDFGANLMFLAVCMQCIAIYGILMSLERIL